MSARHGLSANAEPVLNAGALDRLMADTAVRAVMWRVGQHEDSSYDLPYLAGYSEDGETIFFDRHLPEKVTAELDGQVQTFDPRRFLRLHEQMEKTLMVALRYSYWPAHAAGNAAERRGVVAALGPGWWPVYEKAVMPYVKADEKEKLERVPVDLDMSPYYAEPVDKRLVARMQEAMGQSRKFSKAEVGYSQGMARSHCGPVRGWATGDCAHFEAPHACELVRGYIGERMWCKKWKKVTADGHC